MPHTPDFEETALRTEPSPPLVESVQTSTEVRRVVRWGLVCAGAAAVAISAIVAPKIYEENQQKILSTAYLMTQDGFQPTNAGKRLDTILNLDRANDHYWANVNLGACSVMTTADVTSYPDGTPKDVTAYKFQTANGQSVYVQNYRQLVNSDELGPDLCKSLS